MMQLALFMKTAIKSLLEALSHSSERRILKDMAGGCPPYALGRHDTYTHTHMQGVHGPPFLLPSHPHLSFLL